MLGVFPFFYSLFYSFEDLQLLKLDDTQDIYALHFVFIPIIQKHSDLFQQGWAHHSLRIEHNKTPQQLWIMGLQDQEGVDPDSEAITGLSVSLLCYNNTKFIKLLVIKRMRL